MTESGALDRLHQVHGGLEAELSMLTRRAYLTPPEQERARTIKKEKLKTKDRMRMLQAKLSLTGAKRTTY